MIKNNKLTLAMTSLVTLMPVIAGLILWDKLPATMVTHWNIAGNADGFVSKVFAVFGTPVIFLVIHWICVIVTDKDKKNKEQNPKMLRIVLWICPVSCWLVSGMMYFMSSGDNLESTRIFVFLGLLFCVIGNYLPKCKQNNTIGIKTKWTLENEENWNKTHRVGGIAWFVCGLVMLAAAFLPFNISVPVAVSVMVVAVIVPMVYSYSVYRKNIF